MKQADRPLWFDVYEAFPPRDPPEYQRPVPNQEVPQILYPEDIIRVQFYKTYGNPDVVDLTNEKVKTTCQRFVDKYMELLQTNSANKNIFEATARALREEGIRLRTVSEIQDSSAQAAKMPTAASTTPEIKLTVASIFGEETIARAQAEDNDFEDNSEKDPKLS